MEEPLQHVLHYKRYFAEETDEFATLAEAEKEAEMLSDAGAGFPTKIVCGGEVERDYVQEYVDLMKSQS